MHTSTETFIQLCRMLTRLMEACPRAELSANRERILEDLTTELTREGIVFDRQLAGEIFDQLRDDPSLQAPAKGTEGVRRRVLNRDYFSEQVMDTLSDRLLAALSSVV